MCTGQRQSCPYSSTIRRESNKFYGWDENWLSNHKLACKPNQMRSDWAQNFARGCSIMDDHLGRISWWLVISSGCHQLSTVASLGHPLSSWPWKWVKTLANTLGSSIDLPHYLRIRVLNVSSKFEANPIKIQQIQRPRWKSGPKTVETENLEWASLMLDQRSRRTVYVQLCGKSCWGLIEGMMKILREKKKGNYFQSVGPAVGKSRSVPHSRWNK